MARGLYFRSENYIQIKLSQLSQPVQNRHSYSDKYKAMGKFFLVDMALITALRYQCPLNTKKFSFMILESLVNGVFLTFFQAFNSEGSVLVPRLPGALFIHRVLRSCQGGHGELAQVLDTHKLAF